MNRSLEYRRILFGGHPPDKGADGVGAHRSESARTVPKSLVRIVYRSRSTLHPDNVEELDKIFRISIKNNLRSKLTGCLAHPDGHFVQVIEGESNQVSSLMDRLRGDSRHKDIEILGEWKASSRLFSAWAMARPDLRPLADQSFRLIDEKGSGSQVTAILLSLVQVGTSFYSLV